MAASRKAHNKPVAEITPLSAVSQNYEKLPLFDAGEFNKAVEERGYKVNVEKALRCPCFVKNTGSPLPNCYNCGGSGWFFVSKKETFMLVQSINRKTKFSNWSEEDRGTISVTSKAIDRVAFMDRITVVDINMVHTQIVKCKIYNNVLFGFLFYPSIAIDLIYLFKGSDQPLAVLAETTDYTIDYNKIILNNKFKNLMVQGDADLSLSVRYSCNPSYNILDVNRDISINRSADCKGDELLSNMPIYSIGRKSHMIMDIPDFNGDSLFDNTVYT